MRKTVLALILALLFSAVAETMLVDLGRANPFIRERAKEREISPPEGTLPPIISIFSPENGSAYASNNISLTLNVSMPESNNVSLSISEIYYLASWQHDKSGLIRVDVGQGSINMTDIPEGPRRIEVYAVATGFAYYSRQEIVGFVKTKYYVDYKITGSSVVSFTIDTTSPKISLLSLENKTCSASAVPLSFVTNEQISQSTYSVDGQENVTIAGNTTIAGLSNGHHNVTVYAIDEAGNIGASENIVFTVAESFPVVSVVAVSAGVGGAACAGLLVYFKKRKHSSL